MVLKQRAADVLVDTVRDKVVEILQPRREYVRLLAPLYWLYVEVDEPVERVLVHGINVGQFRAAEEKDWREFGYWDVPGR